MKNALSIVFAIATLTGLLFLTPSCGKKTTPAPATNVVTPPTYSFTAMGITATGVQYTVTNNTASGNGPLHISGSNQSGNATNYQTVDITINSPVNSPGNYPLSSSSSSSGNSGFYTSGGNTVRYSTNTTNTGSLNITSIDLTHKTISGSYSFTAQQYFPTIGTSGTISGSFTNLSYQ